MRFVFPSVELINETDNFKRIEKAARICYQSDDKITEDSAFPFFQRMVKRGHTSTLEHSVIFVRTHTPVACMRLKEILNCYVEETGYQHYIRYSMWDENDTTVYFPVDKEYEGEEFQLGRCIGSEHLFSGNIRAWRKICEKYPGEALLYDTFFFHPAFNDIFVKYQEELYGFSKKLDSVYTKEDIEIVDSIPDDFYDKDKHNIVTLKITGDRGVIDEFARQRVCGISIESTRYCSYKDSGVTFVFPWWYDKLHDEPLYAALAGEFGNRCYDTEVAYQEWMNKCKIPQMARGNLTLWVRSQGAFTATVQQWRDILALRDSPAAHPEAQRIAKMIEKVLVEEVGVEDIWGVKEYGLQCENVNAE